MVVREKKLSSGLPKCMALGFIIQNLCAESRRRKVSRKVDPEKEKRGVWFHESTNAVSNKKDWILPNEWF